MKRVKTNIVDSTKGKAIRIAVNKELANIHYINKAAVDVYGKIEYLTKDQVRALQIVAAKLANSDKEKFEEEWNKRKSALGLQCDKKKAIENKKETK